MGDKVYSQQHIRRSWIQFQAIISSVVKTRRITDRSLHLLDIVKIIVRRSWRRNTTSPFNKHQPMTKVCSMVGSTMKRRSTAAQRMKTSRVMHQTAGASIKINPTTPLLLFLFVPQRRWWILHPPHPNVHLLPLLLVDRLAAYLPPLLFHREDLPQFLVLTLLDLLLHPQLAVMFPHLTVQMISRRRSHPFEVSPLLGCHLSGKHEQHPRLTMHRINKFYAITSPYYTIRL